MQEGPLYCWNLTLDSLAFVGGAIISGLRELSFLLEERCLFKVSLMSHIAVMSPPFLHLGHLIVEIELGRLGSLRFFYVGTPRELEVVQVETAFIRQVGVLPLNAQTFQDPCRDLKGQSLCPQPFFFYFYSLLSHLLYVFQHAKSHLLLAFFIAPRIVSGIKGYQRTVLCQGKAD